MRIIGTINGNMIVDKLIANKSFITIVFLPHSEDSLSVAILSFLYKTISKNSIPVKTSDKEIIPTKKAFLKLFMIGLKEYTWLYSFEMLSKTAYDSIVPKADSELPIKIDDVSLLMDASEIE